jgi:hypothetical protein
MTDYVVTPWNRVMCTELTVAQLFNKSSSCDGTGCIIAVIKQPATASCHGTCIQSTPSPFFFIYHFNIILHSLHLTLASGIFRLNDDDDDDDIDGMRLCY